MSEYPRLQSLKRINGVMTRYYVARKALARFKPLEIGRASCRERV